MPNKVTLELPSLFTATPKAEVLHQAVVAYLANARQSNSHTKLRGEVRGGGRKPWKQKGTGRARAGSSRSPIWVGGGITFGPRSDANFKKRLPDKLRRLALSMALSTKAAEQHIVIVDDFKLAQPKTKLAAEMVAQLAPEAKSILLVTPAVDTQLLQAATNLPNAAVMTVNDLNTYDVLNFDYLVFTQDAVEAAEKIFVKK